MLVLEHILVETADHVKHLRSGQRIEKRGCCKCDRVSSYIQERPLHALPRLLTSNGGSATFPAEPRILRLITPGVSSYTCIIEQHDEMQPLHGRNIWECQLTMTRLTFIVICKAYMKQHFDSLPSYIPSHCLNSALMANDLSPHANDRFGPEPSSCILVFAFLTINSADPV